MARTNAGGARLAYVVVPLKGDVMRDRIIVIERKAGKYRDGTTRIMHEFKREAVKEPAGFMVYFPRGHAVRIRDKERLRELGLDKPANIINLEGLNDPRSPIGKMLLAQDENARRGAFQTLEENVVALATAKTGKVLMPEQLSPKPIEQAAV